MDCGFNNLLFAEILSFFLVLENKKTLNIIGKAITTMAIAALIINIPIVIIFFLKHYRLN